MRVDAGRWPICFLALLLLVGLAATGCARSAPIKVRGAAELNRNAMGESTPVIVRFFELRRDGRFRNAAFDALWADPSEVLGDDLVRGPDETEVFPGEATKVVDLGTLSAETQVIGVMGLYRKAAAGEQRTLVLPIDEVDQHVVELAGYGVRLVEAR